MLTQVEKLDVVEPASRDQFEGNAVDWVLRKVDQSLDEVEENPPAYARAIYDLSTGPVGTAAAKGAVTAAKLTVEASSQALRAAAPVGKWVLSQGFKFAAGAVMTSITGGANKKGKPPQQ